MFLDTIYGLTNWRKKIPVTSNLFNEINDTLGIIYGSVAADNCIYVNPRVL